MQKYLIRFSYFGTHFKGLQMQNRTKDDFQTVQGVLEAGLRYLQPANDPITHTSSRTDAGVHAFDNCLHVELLRQNGKSPYAPNYITHHLNTFLRSAGVDIRVKSTQTVSPAFDARRSACKRHYLYRIALFKEPLAFDDQHYNDENYWPLPEVDRVFIVRKAVDMSKLIEGCALMQREADFASFMTAPANTKPPPENTVRTLEKVSLSPGQTLMDASLDPAYSNLDFYNITFTSRSFLHNQIRRCMAVILALAQGVITKDQVEHMFDNPRPANSPVGVNVSPACGLYLLKVDYPDHVLQPEYCGEESDNVMRRVAVRERVATMTALGNDNFQKENRVVDKFCNVLRRFDDLRESILKETVLMEEAKENSSESKDDENLSKSDDNENVSNFEARKHIQQLTNNEKLSIEFNIEEKKENATSNHDRKVRAMESESDYMLGSTRRRMLSELYTLLETRDEIDEKMRALMEPLIKANVMNISNYDGDAMGRAIREIHEIRRSDRELKVRLAGLEKSHYLPIKKLKKMEGWELELWRTGEKHI